MKCICLGNTLLKFWALRSFNVRSQWYSSSSFTSPTKTWKLEVEPFWKFSAHLTNSSLFIESFNPNQYPNGDLLTISVFSNKKSKNGIHEYKVSSEQRTVFLENVQSDEDDFVVVKVPPVFDINVEIIGKSSVDIANIECDSTVVEAEDGNITLHNIKGKTVTSNTKTGNIKATKLLQGNVNLKAEKGTITTDKLQGSQISVDSGEGGLCLVDVYAEEFKAFAKSGNISIKSLHGSSIVEALKGNIVLGTTEGNLTASSERGNINTHIASPATTNLVANQGDIVLSTPPNLSSLLRLTAKSVTNNALQSFALKEEVKNDSGVVVTGHLESDGPLVQANAVHGNIELHTSTWLERVSKYAKLVQS